MGTYNYVPIVNPNIDITSAINNSNKAYRNALEFLDTLEDYIPTLSGISPQVDFSQITPPTVDWDPGDVPASPDRYIDVPAEFPQVTNIDPVDKSGLNVPAPVLTAQPPSGIGDIPNPGDLTVPAPGPAPSTDFTFEKPIKSDWSLPEVPTMESLSIPSVPTVKDFNFDLLPPDDSNIVVPGNTFSFSDQEYQSQLVDAVTAELLDRVTNGGTGIPVAVENAIWERGKDREAKNQLKTEEEILSKNATRGFQRPPGSVMAALDYAAQEAQHKIADLSREIMIKQADLEQSNIKHAIEQAINLEQMLIANHRDQMNRAFEVAKYAQQIAIALYESQIKQFETKLKAYSTGAEVFRTQVQAELSKVEVYKAQIEGQKLIVDINDSKARLYVSQIEAIKQLVQTYQIEWAAVETQVRAEAAKLEGFKSEVDAYTAQVNGYAASVSAYSERVKAEAAKSDVFEAQVRAYASQVQAYAAQMDAGKTRVDADIEINKLKISETLAKIDAIVKSSQAQATIFNAEVDKYRAEIQGYTAGVTAEEVKQRALTQLFELQIAQANYIANIESKNVEIALSNARTASELLLEKYKSGASISSGLVAASMSGINLSLSESLSASHIETHSYQEK